MPVTRQRNDWNPHPQRLARRCRTVIRIAIERYVNVTIRFQMLLKRINCNLNQQTLFGNASARKLIT
jgi:hypothetical protein